MSSQNSESSRRARLREQNSNWRGGRLVASNGYVLVRVGVDHHLADVRGYAYEHRLVAEESIGRKLQKGEMVHHINGVRTDNRPENLQVVRGNAEHFLHHRKKESGRRMPGEENSDVSCACGCGERFPRYDSSGRPRLYVSGHNRHPNTLADAVRFYLEWVPEQSNSRFMSEFLCEDRRKVTSVLSRLRAAGEVEKVNGQWRIIK